MFRDDEKYILIDKNILDNYNLNFYLIEIIEIKKCLKEIFIDFIKYNFLY